MTLQTYNYIKECIAMGHWVAVKNKNYGWKVFMHERQNGELNGAYFHETISGSLSSGADGFNFSKERMLKFFTDEIQVIPRVPKLLKAGDECIILDTPEIREYAKNEKWEKLNLTLIGTKQKIFGSCSSNYDIGLFSIPHFMVAPVPPQENKLAELDSKELIEELKRRGDIIEGSVVK